MTRRHARQALRLVCFIVALTLGLGLLLSPAALERAGGIRVGVVIACALWYWLLTGLDDGW